MAKENKLKAKELHGQDLADLRKRASEIEENVFNLKVRLKAGTLDSTADIGKARRNLARVKTVIRQKELLAAARPAAAEGKGA
jgi:large subunit ribosomal protein L29